MQFGWLLRHGQSEIWQRSHDLPKSEQSHIENQLSSRTSRIQIRLNVAHSRGNPKRINYVFVSKIHRSAALLNQTLDNIQMTLLNSVVKKKKLHQTQKFQNQYRFFTPLKQSKEVSHRHSSLDRHLRFFRAEIWQHSNDLPIIMKHTKIRKN